MGLRQLCGHATAALDAVSRGDYSVEVRNELSGIVRSLTQLLLGANPDPAGVTQAVQSLRTRLEGLVRREGIDYDWPVELEAWSPRLSGRAAAVHEPKTRGRFHELLLQHRAVRARFHQLAAEAAYDNPEWAAALVQAMQDLTESSDAPLSASRHDLMPF